MIFGVKDEFLQTLLEYTFFLKIFLRVFDDNLSNLSIEK